MTTAPRSSRTTKRPSLHAAGVVTAAGAVLAVGLVAVLLAVVVADSSAVAGAAVASALVIVFFGLSTTVVSVVAALHPRASLLVALLTYTLAVLGLGLALAVLRGPGPLAAVVDRTWLGGVVIVATLVWTAVQVRAGTTLRIPAYDLPERPLEPVSGAPEASAR
ncbi:MAG: hypothetical protein WB441_07640 [Nocardioidaceae bacterium]